MKLSPELYWAFHFSFIFCCCCDHCWLSFGVANLVHKRPVWSLDGLDTWIWISIEILIMPTTQRCHCRASSVGRQKWRVIGLDKPDHIAAYPSIRPSYIEAHFGNSSKAPMSRVHIYINNINRYTHTISTHHVPMDPNDGQLTGASNASFHFE